MIITEQPISLVCGIVTYNCNKKRMIDVLGQAAKTFDHIFVYCNQVDDLSIIQKLQAQFCNSNCGISIVGEGENVGLAKAQNEIARYAQNCGHVWITFLDQDSILEDPLKVLRTAILTEESNNIYVVEYPENGLRFFGGPTYYNASSMTVKLNYFINLGGFLECLSIDWVDFEFCDRVYKSGGCITPLSSISFSHQLGDRLISVLGRKIHLRNDARYYYVVRNAIYLLKSNYISINFRTLLFFRLIFYVIFYQIMSRNKANIFWALFDGFRGRMGTREIRSEI